MTDLNPYFAAPWWADYPQLREQMARWLMRNPMSIADFNALADYLKGTAFAAAAAWSAADVDRLQGLITEALTSGLSPKDFRLAGGELFSNSWYPDMVYRTNVASAQAAGQYAEMWGDLTDVFPYWKFQAIRDSRNDATDECPGIICRTLDGRVFRKDDAAAQGLLPPLHWQCRCRASEVSADYTGRITAGSDISVRPPEGWQYNRIQAYVPDLYAGAA